MLLLCHTACTNSNAKATCFCIGMHVLMARLHTAPLRAPLGQALPASCIDSRIGVAMNAASQPVRGGWREGRVARISRAEALKFPSVFFLTSSPSPSNLAAPQT